MWMCDVRCGMRSGKWEKEGEEERTFPSFLARKGSMASSLHISTTASTTVSIMCLYISKMLPGSDDAAISLFASQPKETEKSVSLFEDKAANW